jgi:protein-S-isoprenylcysteine O-methyltransferase Ste14
MELVFRIFTLLLFAAFIAHRGYYTRRAAREGAAAENQRHETAAVKLANLLSLPALLGTLAYVFAPGWMAWAALPFPLSVRWAGVGVALAGFALLQWSHAALGRNWSDTPRLLADQRLVTDGPYRWVRHPIYAAFLLILGAPLLLSANAFVGGLWLGLTLIDVSGRIRYEEGMLAAAFPAEYPEYAQRTGSLLPRWGRWDFPRKRNPIS